MAEATKRRASDHTTANQSDSDHPQEPPPKRLAAASDHAPDTPVAPSSWVNGRDAPLPDAVTEEQLRGKEFDDLVDIIMDLQSAYTRNLATVSTQYKEVSRQLADMKACLSTFITGQASSLELAGQLLTGATGRPAPPQPRSTSANARSAPDETPLPVPNQPHLASMALAASSTPSSAPAALRAKYVPVAPEPSPPIRHQSTTFPHQHSPTLSTPTSSQAATAASGGGGLGLTSPDPSLDLPFLRHNTAPRATLQLQFPPDDGMPTVIRYSTLHTVREVWREYREGLEGMPSIESLEAQWQSHWRPDAKGRTWFSRRKIVWDKVKEFIHDGLSEEAAVVEVEAMRSGRSMNWLINMLTSNRKEVKASWKAAAAAATAAKLKR